MSNLGTMEIKIRELEERVGVLRTQWPDASRVRPAPSAPYDQAMTELSNSLEELHVLYEELESRGTEVERAYEVIGAERRRYQELFDFAPDGYLTTDPVGNITEANRAACRLLGCTAAFPVGKPLRMFIASEDRQAYDQLLEDLKSADDHVLDRELRIQLISKQEPRSCSVRVVTARSLDDRPVGLRWMLCDASERNKTERLVVEAAARTQQQIGQELHDGVCQQLAGISMMSSTIQQQLDPKVAQELGLERLVGYIRDAQRSVRLMSHGLMPRDVKADALPPALEDLCGSASELHSVNCRLNCPAPLTLGDGTAANHLFRIAQEAVHNAIRHGKADRIEIYLGTDGDRTVLSIRDNGRGLPEDHELNHGIGLQSMRYRAEAVGAALYVGPADGGGTVVACTLAGAAEPAPSPQNSVAVPAS